MPPLSNNNISPFVVGSVYKRSIIHDQYGGNRQGGISASAKYPFIFIFSGEAGHQHGYKDQWVNDDVYSYTGHGQDGDMKFVLGNLALRDHIKTGKRVFLFIEVYRSHFRFEAELELLDVDFIKGKDKNGYVRTSIIFFLIRVGEKLNYPLQQLLSSQIAEDTSPYKINLPNETERTGLVTSRVGQGAYRKSILFRWEFKCAVTNYSKKEILIASHIVPWKGSTNEERLDVDNGILLSPTYDALFDQHLISFENNGKIILSENLLKTNYSSIGITGKESIRNLSSSNMPYLERHRQRL